MKPASIDPPICRKMDANPGDNWYSREVSGELPADSRSFWSPDHRVQVPLCLAHGYGWSPPTVTSGVIVNESSIIAGVAPILNRSHGLALMSCSPG